MRKSKISIVTAGAFALIAGAAIAAVQIRINAPIPLSDGRSGDKPKIQRTGDGTLIVAYGDDTTGAGNAYDLKADIERPARDVYVKTCKPGTARDDGEIRSCDNAEDWSAAINVSRSAGKSSVATAWRGGDPVADRLPYPGDIDKANLKTTGPVITVSWIGNYCPDGDLASPGIQAPAQRAIRYEEREDRIIPFACLWLAYSTDQGSSWSAPVQMSSGLRDAKQEFSNGSINMDPASAAYRKGQIVLAWQEDPQGLQIGEAEGPGDGGSGAKVNGGTDIWYAYANVDLSVPNTPADDFVLSSPLRLSDNWLGGYGITGSVNNVFDASGANVDPSFIEKGGAGASRANIGIVGSTVVVAYEETKNSGGLSSGKFIRYHRFPYSSAPAVAAGCIVSNPAKNARRVRMLRKVRRMRVRTACTWRYSGAKAFSRRAVRRTSCFGAEWAGSPLPTWNPPWTPDAKPRTTPAPSCLPANPRRTSAAIRRRQAIPTSPTTRKPTIPKTPWRTADCCAALRSGSVTAIPSA